MTIESDLLEKGVYANGCVSSGEQSRYLLAELFKLEYLNKSPGNLVKMQVLIQEIGVGPEILHA